MRATIILGIVFILQSNPVAFEMSPPETDEIRTERNAIMFVKFKNKWDPLDIVVSDADNCKPSFPEPIAGRVFCYDKSAKIYK